MKAEKWTVVYYNDKGGESVIHWTGYVNVQQINIVEDQIDDVLILPPLEDGRRRSLPLHAIKLICRTEALVCYE